MRTWPLKVMLTLSMLITSSANTTCPQECRCSTADGMIRIECTEGNMSHIPLGRFDHRAHYVMISAPIDRPNFLTLGPIFTQPTRFVNLKELYILNSNIASIGMHSFWGLQNLEILNLSYNNITVLEVDNFRGLINLRELHIDFNIIDMIPSECFKHLTSLTTLTLTHNHLFTLPFRAFKMLTQLVYLDLSNNPMEFISPNLFQDIQQLRTFICRQCLLRLINTQMYYYVPRLEYLDIGENDFKYFNFDEFFSLVNLKQLKLDGNFLPVIVDYTFSKQQHLRSLSLANNRLAMLAPAAFTNLTSLEHLDISNNKLDRFHLQTFAPVVHSLRTINFSGNNLSLNEIAIVLQILPELHGVGLAYLSIKEVPLNFFAYNLNLVAVDLSGNEITKFPIEAFSKLRFLQRLNMSYNQLKYLDEPALERLEAIAQIDLVGNPWRCERCLAGFTLVYMETTVLNASLRRLACDSPPHLRNVLFGDLTKDMLQPCILAHETQVSIIAGLMLVCIAILAAVATVICCKRRRASQYYTHEEKRRNRAAAAARPDECTNDAPVELLSQSEPANVATIHAPYHLAPKSS